MALSVAHDDDDDFDDDEEEEVVAAPTRSTIMAITMSKTIAGVALYSPSKNTIHTTQLSASSATLCGRLEDIILAAPPRLVITNNTTANDLGFISFITSDGAADHEVTSNVNWEYTTAKLRVMEHLFVRDLMDSSIWANRMDSSSGSAVDSQAGDARRPPVTYDNLQLLASELPFQERARISALGGLVGWLSKHVFNLEKSGHVHVRSLAPVESLVEGHCVIDPVSLRALSIFVEEFHPSQAKGRGRSKEGFSLFGIFDHTASRGGRRCLKEWFRSPLATSEAIRFRQNGVELFTPPEVKEIEADVHKSLRKVADLPSILLRVKKVQGTFRDWCRVSETCEALWAIIDLLRVLLPRVSDAGKAWIADKLDRCDLPTLQRCYRVISDSIDVDLSKSSKQTCIREGYSGELDALRAQWDDVEGILETAAKRTLDTLPNVASVRAEFIAHIGYHVVLPRDDEQYATGPAAGGGGGGGLEFMFEQNDLLYYKTPLMRQYDADIGDIPSRYHDKVKELLMAVEEALLSHELALNTMVAAVCEVDATISLARVAREFDFVRPRIVDSSVVLVKGGRHPLQQLVVDSFIPNDVALGADGINAAVITGPNFSGKSVYLKQVGIIVFLAHVGSFVPAEDAIIGVVDRIFTRIESLETCTVAQSTFNIDLNQMAVMLRRCTKRSLLLVDEFGKGTAPADGMALLASMIKSIVEQPNPLFVLTTHFLEIFEMNLLDAAVSAKLRMFRMDFVVPAAPPKKVSSSSSSASSFSSSSSSSSSSSFDGPRKKQKQDPLDDFDCDDEESSGGGAAGGGGGGGEGDGNDTDSDSDDGGADIVVPLFTLVPGVAKSSDGLACAKLGNLPTRLINRSREVMHLMNSGKQIQPLKSKPRGDAGDGRGGGNALSSSNDVAEQLLHLFLETDEPFESIDESSVQTLFKLKELVGML